MDAEARENLRQMPLEQLEVEQTRKLALKDSSVYLLGAGASMAAEGKRMCRKLREMLDRIFLFTLLLRPGQAQNIFYNGR